MTIEQELIERDILARHRALVRMFGENHDPRHDIPTVHTNACDCIQFVMRTYNYFPVLEGEIHRLGYGREIDWDRWMKL